jgi:glycosyltransferase involved in cell wall biosynthesis
MKKIVLITTGQPSTNPRIVKEADALVSAGYQVILLYCYYIDWAWHADKKIVGKAKWQSKLVGGSPYSKKWLYFITRLQFKLSFFLNKYLGDKCGLAERAQARCFIQLKNAAKKIKADWYIGHNLGALGVVVQAAKHNNAKCGFDFEDYHRAEIERMQTKDIQRVIYLENKYIPFLQYISTASPLITIQVKSNFPVFKNSIITLLNVFPLNQKPTFRNRLSSDNTLQLFWFSQTVGSNRGLEILLDALQQLQNKNIHLTLAGRYTAEIKTSFEKRAGSMGANIHFAGIIQPEELPAFASKFDVGLALEPAFSINNNIALSNKIFTYLLAGTALLVSETSMQKMFVENNKTGLSFPINDVQKLKQLLEYYLNKEQLDKERMHNWQLAHTSLNWENESRKLLEVIT